MNGQLSVELDGRHQSTLSIVFDLSALMVLDVTDAVLHSIVIGGLSAVPALSFLQLSDLLGEPVLLLDLLLSGT